MHKILERSKGTIDLELKNNNLIKLYQSGCSKVLIPNSYICNNELVLINTAGGITCNDVIKTNINLENSQTSITTQAAEKIYAGFGDPANVEINISIKNSNLYWLPKELIIFNNSKINRRINLNLHDNSNLFFCETSIFGRQAMSEIITNLIYSDIWKININSKLKHLEAINLKDHISDNIKNNFTFRKNSAIATILIFGNIVEKIQNDISNVIKKIKDPHCEISIWDEKIIVRIIYKDNYDLKKKLNYIMKNIIHDKLPKSWDL